MRSAIVYLEAMCPRSWFFFNIGSKIPAPATFVEFLAAILLGLGFLLTLVSFFPKLENHSKRFAAILLVAALALFSQSWGTYFASVFIIATAVTELEFLQILAAIIRGDKNYFDWRRATAGQVKPPEQDPDRRRRPAEYKILNTLWTKQVNKWPDFSAVFTFKISANSHEFMAFREASNILLGEGLITETDAGQVYFTRAGFEYCKEHFKEFPPDQWWPEEPINPENLKKVLGA